MTGVTADGQVSGSAETQDALTPSDEQSEMADCDSRSTDFELEFQKLANIDAEDIDWTDSINSETIDTERNKFRRQQESDPTRTALWERAKWGSSEFRIVSRLLFRAAPVNAAPTDDELQVPTGDTSAVIDRCNQSGP